MLISEVIATVKKYHKGLVRMNRETDVLVPIDEKTTRDKILYGNPEVECTGIVTTCWANMEVIRQAKDLGANLIICHEALFYNHGDHQEWLQNSKNPTYMRKAALLDEAGIVVWRDHDYIHSGIPMDGGWVDGIFYGVANKLGWLPYMSGNKEQPMRFVLPETTVEELANHLVNTFELNGVRIYGDLSNKVSKVIIPMHILGDGNEYILEAGRGDADCILAMEMVDFTLAEYIIDSSQMDGSVSAISMGHFNMEEPGMEYMLEYLPGLVDVPCHYVQSGDNYKYLTRKINYVKMKNN